MTILIRCFVAAITIAAVSENSWLAGTDALAGLLPLALVASSDRQWTKRFGARLANFACFVLPCLTLVDTTVFQWTGSHLWSPLVGRAVTDLRAGLFSYASANVMRGIGVLVAKIALYVSVAWALGRIGSRWQISVTPIATCTAIAWIAVLGHHGNIPKPEWAATTTKQVTNDTAQSFQSMVLRRDADQRMMSVSSLDESGSDHENRPDILIVIAESFRHELITPEGTPNLWKLANEGIWCRNHFSGGNATNHGIFSIVSGLEAIWYSRPVRYSPPLNRLFHRSGYEIGFFAGHDDWRVFRMDGFISDEHYDEFSAEPPDGLSSDRQATMRAIEYLRPSDEPTRKPRLAILYLYATHATFNSYPDDQKFQPAADDRFTIPYPPSAADEVWNRYRNAAVTADRFIGAALGDDDTARNRIFVFTGDHGESFLEDGTIGHGTKLSPQQNMTPAIIRIPGGSHRVIDSPTMHADILPTLLAAAGIELTVQNRPVLDGIDLASASEDTLAQRFFVTRNYFDDQVAIIHDRDPMQNEIEVSLDEFTIKGNTDHLQSWIDARFKPSQSRQPK
ncbi:sulfatase-like hydrolase/transferase [Rubripirellula reticaptiva]|uniref:Inner membrane protein YejM n=1 Tax=Rubripirellula reticaptiva TaxID=2528013 RepID=A0A5C6EIF8_9BACT|nr:sulfatase-like hydrolase/transferase [Rubripirellula reticaptiva]TWU48235.1 Inner membrane protein YejM [Rubripirellula reticaptiva]